MNRAVSFDKDILNRILRIAVISKQPTAIAEDLLLKLVDDRCERLLVPLLHASDQRFDEGLLPSLFPFRFTPLLAFNYTI